MAFKILVTEDEEITLNNLVETLQEEGYDVEGARDGNTASSMITKKYYNLLITDIKIPGPNGITLLSLTKERSPETEVIIITGFGSIGSAVEAMKKGACDYITKPFDLDEIVLRVKKIYEQKKAHNEIIALKTFCGMNKKIPIIVKSTSMKKILSFIEGMKDSDCNVLLTGESGVGKNLIAKLIHFTSRRHNNPFLSINCATLTEELLSSELFGHEKGAFTGASVTKKGLVEIADSGALFLDEIAELSPSLQAKLLKAVDEGEFYRVGGIRLIKVNVRYIVATNQNVKQLILENRFREDLYYRFNIMEINLPPLRERSEDIKPLSVFFLQKHLPKYGKKITGFSNEAFDTLMKYSFPGNVRELENVIERAIILEKSDLITPESLPRSIKTLHIETFDTGSIKTINEITKEYAEKVLRMMGGNKSKASETLGISRTSLWKILKED